MSPLTSDQIVSLAEVVLHKYPGGFAFQAGHPVPEHALVGVLNARRNVLARELIVRHENRVAHVHLAKRDVNGMALACVAWRERGVLFDGEHAAFPLGWVSEWIVNRELKVMRTCGVRYLLLPTRNHLKGTGGSGWRPRAAGFSLTATTATSYYLKRMARVEVLYEYPVEMGWARGPAQYDAKRSVAEVAVGVVQASSPGGPWVSAATSPGGSTRLIPAPSAHQMQIESNAHVLRITANNAEVGI